MSYAVGDMITEVYEAMGESSDLNPYDASGAIDMNSDGAKRILLWLNRAYRKVCNTQLGDGTMVRFRSLERRQFFTAGTITSTVVSVVSANQIKVSGLFSVADRYNNWILDLEAADAASQGTEQHVIIGTTSDSPPILTLADDIVTTPSVGDKVNLYKKWWACSLLSTNVHPNEFIPIDPKEDFLSALWVYDVQTQKDIRRYDERTPLYKQVLSRLYPGLIWDLETPKGGWWSAGIGGGIEFDVAPNDSEVFELHYYGVSELLTSVNQIIMVPDAFSEPIIKWATKTGMLRDREWDGAYALRKEFEADMQTLIQDGQFRFEYDFGQLWIEP